MVRRIGVMGAAMAVIALGPAGAPEAAAAAKTWCMTYCDGIELACRHSLGLWEPDTCKHWHEGCLDGCRVND